MNNLFLRLSDTVLFPLEGVSCLASLNMKASDRAIPLTEPSQNPLNCSTRSHFVTLLSRRAQSGLWSSFRKRVWFTESHIVLIIYCLFVVLFTQFIVDKMK